MFNPFHLLVAACVFLGAVCQSGLAEQPHEFWLKALEGTWTANEDGRGKVTVSFKSEAGGKCLVGKGTDKNGAFITVIGWETWDVAPEGHTKKQLRWTTYHSNGGGGRTSFVIPLAYGLKEHWEHPYWKTRMQGPRWTAGPGGEFQLPSTATVFWEGNTFTVSTTHEHTGLVPQISKPDIEAYGKATKTVYTKVVKK